MARARPVGIFDDSGKIITSSSNTFNPNAGRIPAGTGSSIASNTRTNAAKADAAALPAATKQTAWQKAGFKSAGEYLAWVRQQDAGSTKAEVDALLAGYGGGVTDAVDTVIPEVVAEPFANVVGTGNPIYQPELLSGAQISDSYGITNDRAEIEALLNSVIDAQYDRVGLQQDRSEDLFYDQLGAVQNTVLDTLGKNNLAALQTGASRGAQSANELSAILGLEQESVLGATDLSIQRRDNVLAEQEARRLASSDALTQANKAGISMGEIAAQILNAQEVGYGSELNYDATLQGILGSIEAQRIASAGQVNAAALGGGGGSTDPLAGVFETMSPSQQMAYFLSQSGIAPEDWASFFSKGNLGADDETYFKTTGDYVPTSGQQDEIDVIIKKIYETNRGKK